MRLCVFAFGKLKTPGLREAAEYYQRLIRPWIPIEEVEFKPISVPEKSAATRLKIQEKEGLLLLERIEKESKGRGLVFLMDEGGKTKTTLQWAQDFQKWELESISHVYFCIGSSLGFSKAVRNISAGILSFGQQTLSHELARVVLYEQLYRVYSVNRGHPYHNEGS